MERKMTVKEAYIRFWKNAFKMKGRARRKEYWMPVLINIVIMFVLFFIGSYFDQPTGNTIGSDNSYGEMAVNLFGLITLIPNFTLFARRLQDININGWWALLPNFYSVFVVLLLIPLAITVGLTGVEFNFTFLIIVGTILTIGYFVVLIWFLILTLKDGTVGANKYGEDPKGRHQMLNGGISNGEM